MCRMAITAMVAAIEVPAYALMGMQQEVVLHDVTADGLPLPDGTRTNLTGQMRALDLMPGDRIAFVANPDAHDVNRRVIGEDLDDPVWFLRSLPREARTGVRFRLRHPGGIRRVR